jgi:hypothetical protein
MKTIKFYLFILIAVLLYASCEEEKVNRAASDDKVPPQPPSNITYTPLFGGARFNYDLPPDEDLLSVDAEFTNDEGETFTFSASYFVDSLEVGGVGDTTEYNVELFGVDRAGNKSDPAVVSVVPLESAISRVMSSFNVQPAFSSFFVEWENELEQNINVYIDFSYTENGVDKEFTSVFSSNVETDRRFIEDLYLSPEIPVNVKVRVGDMYGNSTPLVDKGDINLLVDNKLPKEDWFLPAANDSVGGIPQAFGNNVEGRLYYIKDDELDVGENLNFMHTGGYGRTGNPIDGNMPWNVIIDLGDYYELSRIVTHQRWMNFSDPLTRGQYYGSENVGIYEMYIFDEDLEEWVFVSENKIEVPEGLSELEYWKKGQAGDMAYMYPDEPHYTKPTRWFRYRAMKSFNSNYTLDDANCLSEITLYGRKAEN